MNNKKAAPIEFLWLGLYSFAGFSLELILMVVLNIFNVGPSISLHAGLTAALWFIASYLILHYAHKKFSFDPVNVHAHLDKRHLIMIGAIFILLILVTSILFQGFKPLVEFHGDLQKSVLALIMRIIYYLAESGLILLTICFGQAFFEGQFSLPSYLPSGGFFLALTWGLIHFLLQGFSGGVFTIFFSLLTGTLFVLVKKDFKKSYLLIALALIL